MMRRTTSSRALNRKCRKNSEKVRFGRVGENCLRFLNTHAARQASDVAILTPVRGKFGILFVRIGQWQRLSFKGIFKPAKHKTMQRTFGTAVWAVVCSLFMLAHPAHAQTVPGTALSFNGINQIMIIGGTSVPPPWTAEFWVNRQNANGFSAALLADTYTALKLEQFNYTRQIGFTQFGVTDYLFNYAVPTNTWVHLAFVCNTNTRLYVNGVLQDQNPATISLPLQQLGSDPRFGDYFKGMLDEVRVWNVARSQAQIQANLNRTLSLPQANLLAYWRFDEGSGANAFDSGGSGHTGVLVGGPVWVNSTVPFLPVITNEPASTVIRKPHPDNGK